MSDDRERVTAATAAVSAQSGFGPPPGTILFERYRVESLLGLGGSGVVLKATELATGDLVAIKLLRDDIAVDEETRVRLMREAAAAVRLRSVHAAKIRDVGTSPDGQPFMVMELLHGMDLGRLLQANQRLDPAFAVELAFQVCDALAEAHGIGIIHRDIKPSNLFVTWRADGTIRTKVLDFGISKTPQSEGLVITSRAAVLGTPAYMSPEQMRSASTVDVRTDVWSLGAVLFEMIEGRPPFVGTNYADMCVLVSTEPAPRMKDAPALDPIIQRCLAKDPAGRYPSIADLAYALAPLTKDVHAAHTRLPKLFRMAGKPAPFTSAQMDAVAPELALATGTPLPADTRGQIHSGSYPSIEQAPQRSVQPSSPPPNDPFATYEQTGVRMKQVRAKQPSGPQPEPTTGQERAVPSGEQRAIGRGQPSGVPPTGEQRAIDRGRQPGVPPTGEQQRAIDGRSEPSGVPPTGEQRAIDGRGQPPSAVPTGGRAIDHYRRADERGQPPSGGPRVPPGEQRAVDGRGQPPSGGPRVPPSGDPRVPPTGEQRALDGRSPSAAPRVSPTGERRAVERGWAQPPSGDGVPPIEGRVRTKHGVPTGDPRVPSTVPPTGEQRAIDRGPSRPSGTAHGVPSGELPAAPSNPERRVVRAPDGLRSDSAAVPVRTLPGAAPVAAPKRDSARPAANKSGAQAPQSASAATDDRFPPAPVSEHFAHAATVPSGPHPQVDDDAPPARGSQPDPLLEARIPIASGSDPALEADDLDAHDTVIGAPIDTLREEPDPDMPIPPLDLAPRDAKRESARDAARDAAARGETERESAHDAAAREVQRESAREHDVAALDAQRDSHDAQRGELSHARDPLSDDVRDARDMVRDIAARDMAMRDVAMSSVAPRRLFDARGIAIALLVVATIALAVVFQLGLLD